MRNKIYERKNIFYEINSSLIIVEEKMCGFEEIVVEIIKY